MKELVEQTLGTSLNRLKQRRFKFLNLLFSCSIAKGNTVLDLGVYLSPEIRAKFTSQELCSTVHYPKVAPHKSDLDERCRKRAEKLQLFDNELHSLLKLLDAAKSHGKVGWELVNASWRKANR